MSLPFPFCSAVPEIQAWFFPASHTNLTGLNAFVFPYPKSRCDMEYSRAGDVRFSYLKVWVAIYSFKRLQLCMFLVVLQGWVSRISTLWIFGFGFKSHAIVSVF